MNYPGNMICHILINLDCRKDRQAKWNNFQECPSQINIILQFSLVKENFRICLAPSGKLDLSVLVCVNLVFHHAGRALTSDLFINSFIMVVPEEFF